jgi:hypothetical protein
MIAGLYIYIPLLPSQNAAKNKGDGSVVLWLYTSAGSKIYNNTYIDMLTFTYRFPHS